MREHRRGVYHQQHGVAEEGDHHRTERSLGSHPQGRGSANHRPVTKTFKKKAAAKSWARDIESTLSKGEQADSEAERRTLADACEQYVEAHPDIASDHKRRVAGQVGRVETRLYAREIIPPDLHLALFG